MKTLFATLILFAAFVPSFAQNEQAPMQEKEIAYQNWTYKSIRTGEDINLRELTKGKKLTIVVYYAPWCGNWKHDAPILQRFYDKYNDKGLEIVAVGLYDPLDSMKANLNELKLTFPAVYESAERGAKQTSLHYKYRRSTGDVRNWGSPWYIFLTPAVMEKTGDTLTKKTFIINGEVIETEGEAFIRKQLGLAADTKGAAAKSAKIEVCDPNDSKTSLKKPE
jgi:thiol-disulfide isomerase/thioredoxin